MLSRSVSVNQENAHKTPMRSSSFALHGGGAFKTANGKMAGNPSNTHQPGTATAHKRQALTTTKHNRVLLGQKDGNRTGAPSQGSKDSGLLFQDVQPKKKAALATPGPSLKYLTPSPRVRQAALQLPSPDIQAPVQVDEPAVPEIDEEAEVEYAGASARDYDEPVESDWDYDMRDLGTSVREMSVWLGGSQTAEEWESKDAIERSQFKAELVDVPSLESDAMSGPLFPLPKRAPLAQRSTNRSVSRSSLASTSTINRKPATSATPRQSILTTKPSLQKTVPKPFALSASKNRGDVSTRAHRPSPSLSSIAERPSPHSQSAAFDMRAAERELGSFGIEDYEPDPILLEDAHCEREDFLFSI